MQYKTEIKYRFRNAEGEVETITARIPDFMESARGLAEIMHAQGTYAATEAAKRSDEYNRLAAEAVKAQRDPDADPECVAAFAAIMACPADELEQWTSVRVAGWERALDLVTGWENGTGPMDLEAARKRARIDRRSVGALAAVARVLFQGDPQKWQENDPDGADGE